MVEVWEAETVRDRLVGSATVPVGDLVRARDAEQLKYAVSAAQDRAAMMQYGSAGPPSRAGSSGHNLHTYETGSPAKY